MDSGIASKYERVVIKGRKRVGPGARGSGWSATLLLARRNDLLPNPYLGRGLVGHTLFFTPRVN